VHKISNIDNKHADTVYKISDIDNKNKQAGQKNGKENRYIDNKNVYIPIYYLVFGGGVCV
jgi:hypothetical protein